MKHYTQLSREAQEDYDRFMWEEKHRADMAVWKLMAGGAIALACWFGWML